MSVDLSKLTKEHKLRLFDLIQEQKKRALEKKSTYKPNEGQLPIHKSGKTIKFVSSGNGAGKTTAAIQEVMWACQGYHPVKKTFTRVPADLAVVLDKPDKADTVWIPEMRRWFILKPEQLLKRGRPNTTQITFDNGSTITFFSHDQDPLTFESTQFDACCYDEPPPEFIFTALRRSTRKKGTQPWHLIIGTPLSQPWLRQKIWEPWAKGELPEADCFRMASDVNKENINWDEQEKNFAFMSERERRIRQMGDFFDLEGLALAHLFDRSTHLVPTERWTFDPGWPVVMAIDPHPRKKNCAVLLGADPDNQLYVIKELALKETPRDFAKSLKKWSEGCHVIDIVCDSLGSQDMTGGEGFKSFIQVLNEEGIRARATTYDEKQDEAFIARIQDVLRIPTEKDNFGRTIPKLRIHENCRHLTSDIENVCWEYDKKNAEAKPKLAIANKDMLACLKYALATNLYFKKQRETAYVMAKPVYGFRTPSQRRNKAVS
jgi:hypothetical protein